MKIHARILGIDDSEFCSNDDKVKIAGVLARIPFYIEAVMISEADVDGTDINTVLKDMILRSRYKEQINLILLDGITFGGFNIVDISDLNRTLNIPIATVTRRRPSMNAIKTALKKHFNDWEKRYSCIQSARPKRFRIGSHTMYCRGEGISDDELSFALERTTIHGAIPEPLRVAHLFASAIARGESRGL